MHRLAPPVAPLCNSVAHRPHGPHGPTLPHTAHNACTGALAARQLPTMAQCSLTNL
ncbi:hypothetical protein JYU34_008376 [Plutella xylostella]|uniref:Uncharacterized protein n=1 Tax=Plutella xylostella TaxID=51655 RepID=A0ABQ7QLS1_PLUXY|nr:hypothetical protein JYU34_008376 [Plutella xylostella]